ncbi:MAG: 5-formyltetrahydrofolate cyclo-ligase [Clostridia bacterium]|nr:5-formyltetrahydrofolate cyclo-ligase [Clostridia bacterium]
MNKENKDEIRAAMRAKRAALDAAAQQEASRAAARRILSLNAYKDAKTVMAYAAVRGELSLAPVLEEILASGKTLAMPRCETPGVMTARRITALDELVPGMYGLPEPAPSCAVIAPEEIDLILVPGTAFDRAGNRIGQGGGYYDRYLPGTRAVRAGICHDFALLERICAQAHDVRMDAVVTPTGVFMPENNEK